MIRRISKNNDYLDVIDSCPKEVVDDIYKIEYYISGYNVTVDASFSKVGSHLEVIIPSSDLATLPNGILMRRAYYKVIDPSYPDGYYNLEFVDSLDMWLGEDEVEPVPPAPGDYVTEGELTSVLSSYTTQSWVESQGYLTSVTLDGYATESWVQSQGYLTSVPEGYATESWVQSQGYITSTGLSGLATQSWVESQGYLTEVPSGYATESWVESQGYLTSHQSLDGYATESWVSSNYFEASRVWTGPQSLWELLTSEQQAFYTIALVTE